MKTNTTENWKDEFLKVIHEFDSEVDGSKKKFGMGGFRGSIAEAECFVQLRQRFESMEGYSVDDHPDYPADHPEQQEFCITKDEYPERGFTVMKEVYTHGTFLQWFE